MIKQMRKIKLAFISILFITHDIDEAVLTSDRIYIMSGKPGKIVKEMKININRHEDNEEILLSEKFLKYKKEIMEFLIK